MARPARIRVAACSVLVLLVVVLSACGGGSTQGAATTGSISKSIATTGGAMASSDGHLHLTFPSGALAHQTTITIRTLDPSQVPQALEAAQPLGKVYSLEPNGLQFSAPVSVTLDGLTPPSSSASRYVLPVLASVPGGSSQLVLLSDQHAGAGASSSVVSLSATTTHFSDVAEVNAATYDLTPATFSGLVDSAWGATLTVTNALPPGSAYGISYGEGRLSSSGAVEYQKIDLVPCNLQAMEPGEKCTVSVPHDTYFCPGAGTGAYGIASFRIFASQILNPSGKQVPEFGPEQLLADNLSVSGSATCTATTTSSTSTSTTTTTVATTAAPRYPGAITAYFDQGAFTTYYTEPIYDPTWTYQWSATIPVDPQCENGFTGSTPTPDKAKWYHANTTQGGPCNHSGDAYNDTVGHPGTVTLVVMPPDKSWTCEMLFNGTAPNNQDPRSPAVGNNPQCQRK